jgi:hypothetical protein
MVLVGKDGGTEVTWYWNVRTQNWWMNTFAFLLRPLLSWNHHQVMAEGERGLVRWLEKPSNPAMKATFTSSG